MPPLETAALAATIAVAALAGMAFTAPPSGLGRGAGAGMPGTAFPAAVHAATPRAESRGLALAGVSAAR